MSDYGRYQSQSQEYGAQLREFVGPLLVNLDEQLDKRLVRTFLKTLEAVITFRHSVYGLLLSELGSYILSPEHAPAGTKRLSNLLRSNKWTAKVIEDFLWTAASQRVAEGQANGQRVYVGWDESVVEKPESIALEGLCAVRSTTAARLKRIKPGFFNPPGGRPVFVPGMQWISLLVLVSSLPPVVAAMQWWTTRGPHASSRRDEERWLLERCHQSWGQRVVHVWDRGFASYSWLREVLHYQLRFILRWPKRFRVLNAQGEFLNAWKVIRGKRSMAYRDLWDNRRRCWRKTGIFFASVMLPTLDDPLWLVVSRPGSGREPWYLLTNEPVHSVDDAWRIVFAYARRWQLETIFRFSKTELAMESPRLWFWHNRLKFMLMVALVYAFLLSLLSLPALARSDLLRAWCHRTGKRYRDASIPLYRLRSALSRLWAAFPPSLSYQSPG
jgi:hypothetical protein